MHFFTLLFIGVMLSARIYPSGAMKDNRAVSEHMFIGDISPRFQNQVVKLIGISSEMLDPQLTQACVELVDYRNELKKNASVHTQQNQCNIMEDEVFYRMLTAVNAPFVSDFSAVMQGLRHIAPQDRQALLERYQYKPNSSELLSGNWQEFLNSYEWREWRDRLIYLISSKKLREIYTSEPEIRFCLAYFKLFFKALDERAIAMVKQEVETLGDGSLESPNASLIDVLFLLDFDCYSRSLLHKPINAQIIKRLSAQQFLEAFIRTYKCAVAEYNTIAGVRDESAIAYLDNLFKKYEKNIRVFLKRLKDNEGTATILADKELSAKSNDFGKLSDYLYALCNFSSVKLPFLLHGSGPDSHRKDTGIVLGTNRSFHEIIGPNSSKLLFNMLSRISVLPLEAEGSLRISRANDWLVGAVLPPGPSVAAPAIKKSKRAGRNQSFEQYVNTSNSRANVSLREDDGKPKNKGKAREQEPTGSGLIKPIVQNVAAEDPASLQSPLPDTLLPYFSTSNAMEDLELAQNIMSICHKPEHSSRFKWPYQYASFSALNGVKIVNLSDGRIVCIDMQLKESFAFSKNQKNMAELVSDSLSFPFGYEPRVIGQWSMNDRHRFGGVYLDYLVASYGIQEMFQDPFNGQLTKNWVLHGMHVDIASGKMIQNAAFCLGLSHTGTVFHRFLTVSGNHPFNQ